MELIFSAVLLFRMSLMVTGVDMSLGDTQKHSTVTLGSSNTEDLGSVKLDTKHVDMEQTVVASDCKCSETEPSCDCNFRIPSIDMNVLYRIGYSPKDGSIALLQSLDGYMIVDDNLDISGDKTYMAACKSLPSPKNWLKGCFTMNIAGNIGSQQKMTLCSETDLKITTQEGRNQMLTVKFPCIALAKVNGLDSLEFKSFPGKDAANNDVRVSGEFEKFCQEFNKLKNSNLKNQPLINNDSLEVLFGNKWLKTDYTPSVKQKRVKRQANNNKGGPPKINWWLLGRDQIPYIAVLYKGPKTPPSVDVRGMKNFYSTNNAAKNAKHRIQMRQSKPEGLEPGLACGGALLSPDRVLTICACIRTFYYINKFKKEAPGQGSKFDIKVTAGETIYLDHSMIQFAGTRVFHLDPTKFDDNMSCFKSINSGSEGQQAELVVMSFTPKMAGHDPFRFVLWPPFPIHQKYNQKPGCTLVAFGVSGKQEGMKFTDDSGADINFKTAGVAISINRNKETDYCIKETFQKGQVPEAFKMKTTCFSSADAQYQLCKGLIGFPITVGDELAGLTATPIDCTTPDGSVMAAVFDDAIVKEVETNVGKGLKTRRAALHTFLYREPEKIVHIIPDYTTSDEPQRAHSSGKRRTCSDLLVFLVFSVTSVSLQRCSLVREGFSSLF